MSMITLYCVGNGTVFTSISNKYDLTPDLNNASIFRTQANAAAKIREWHRTITKWEGWLSDGGYLKTHGPKETAKLQQLIRSAKTLRVMPLVAALKP